MLQIWRVAKGYLAGAVAFVACPCHLPITLPLLIALTAGTAFGAWLEHNAVTVGLISTVIFIGGVVLAFKWIGESAVFSHNPSLSPTSEMLSLSAQSEMPTVTLLTSAVCASCREARTIWQQARRQADFQFEEVDLTSARGRELAAKHNFQHTCYVSEWTDSGTRYTEFVRSSGAGPNQFRPYHTTDRTDLANDTMWQVRLLFTQTPRDSR